MWHHEYPRTIAVSCSRRFYIKVKLKGNFDLNIEVELQLNNLFYYFFIFYERR